MWAYNYTNPTELYHHGVLGMKWGKHRARSTSSSSSGSGKKTTGKGDNESASSTKKKGLSDKQKTALKIGAAAAGTALTAYVAYKVSKLVKDKKVKPFTTQQLRDMGIDVFEPVRFEPARIKI